MLIAALDHVVCFENLKNIKYDITTMAVAIERAIWFQTFVFGSIVVFFSITDSRTNARAACE